jgi:hypothetical protein
MASTPTITIGALIFLVFSHPLLTAGSFSSYLYWKASNFLAGFFFVLSESVMQSAALSRASSLFVLLAQSPFLFGLGGLVISLLGACALWVLYKNLIATSSDDRYARARV